jgi:hypothetical protein
VQAWILDELKTADLGDKRLNRRLAGVLDAFSQRPTASIPAACKGRNEMEAAYRLFDNPRVGDAKVLAPHHDATLQRMGQHPVVLLAQDTTELDLTRPQEQVGGPLNDENHTGLYAHPLIAFTPDRVPLGVVHVQLWARDPEDFRKRQTRKQRPLQDKESHRWLEGYRQACAVAAQTPATEVICLSDSEGDIYEALLEAQPEPGRRKARFIIRACQDRCLAQEPEPTTPVEAVAARDPADEADPKGRLELAKLFEAVAAGPVRATLTVRVSRRAASPAETRKRKKARPAREAVVAVRAARVQLRGPKRPGGRLEDLEVNAVLVREEGAPAGEEPVEWLLLTDLPIGTAGEVLRVVSYYCVRWQIEVFFGVLKGGCRVQERQLETAERFRACLAVYLIVAWRVLFVTMLGRQEPEAPCDVLFDEDEWRAAYTVVEGRPAPATPPPLGEMIGLVARLGGHLGRQHDGPPGPKVMWRGLQRLMDFAACWRAFGPGQSNHSTSASKMGTDTAVPLPACPGPRTDARVDLSGRDNKQPTHSSIYVEG